MILPRYQLFFLLSVISSSANAQFNFQQLMAIPQVRQMMPYAQRLMQNRGGGFGGGLSGSRSVSRVSSADADDSSDRATSTQDSELNDTYYIRSGPGSRYPDKGLVRDYNGSAKATGRRSGNWLEVKLPNGKRGWVNSKALTKIAKKDSAIEVQSTAKTEAPPPPKTESVRPADPKVSVADEAPVTHAAPEVPAAREPTRTEIPPADQVGPVERDTVTEAKQEPVKAEEPPKVIDKSKPQCAESPKELEANSTLKAKLKGYTPFTSWTGGNSDIRYDEKSEKMQVVIHDDVAEMAAKFGFAKVNPIPVKVCMDNEESEPYVFLGPTKIKTPATKVTVGKGMKSDTYKIDASR